jgi:1,4-alpha-glucan branching enzyme
MKSNPTRATITKAAPINTQPANVELATIQPVKSAPVKPAPVKATPAKPALAKTRLEFVKPEAKSVFVAGSFNDWSPSKTPLSRTRDGKWVGELTGISGRHEYLFVVDGQWLPDPNAIESVQNPYGGKNSVLVAAV